MEKEKKEMALEAIKKLKPNDKKDDFYKKVGDELSQDEADIIFEAYQKGCNEYNWRAWNAEGKYQKLCIVVCEKYLI
jgi:hypothetical protein